ncbi:hypothetical protein CM19_03035 [Candidatus Acidianus copahuensis]|uniref:Uncharacterized protein n=3 Tax=Acidianus TaxID=12914 RepID=A0A031LUR5_9CREN|nr:hypothetical protein CM19_03035 [Candidatus Acidianus copahuensis]
MEDILDWYQEKVKGFLIYLEKEKAYLLIVLDNVDMISFVARGEIWNFFLERTTRTAEFRNFVKQKKRGPEIFGVILSPNEIAYHIPITVLMLNNGYILFDPEKILEKEKSKFNVHIKEYKEGKIIDFAKVKKGEVVDV